MKPRLDGEIDTDKRLPVEYRVDETAECPNGQSTRREAPGEAEADMRLWIEARREERADALESPGSQRQGNGPDQASAHPPLPSGRAET